MSKQLLRIDASMRKNGSYSRKLGDRLIEQLVVVKITVPLHSISKGIRLEK